MKLEGKMRGNPRKEKKKKMYKDVSELSELSWKWRAVRNPGENILPPASLLGLLAQ